MKGASFPSLRGGEADEAIQRPRQLRSGLLRSARNDGGGRAGRWDVPTQPRRPSSDSASRATFSRGREKDSRANLPPSPSPSPRGRGVRVAGMSQPSRGVPHPTPLRGATFSRGREKDSRANLPPSPSPSPRGGGVRVVGMFQPSPSVPHPTPLRGATFSHWWEKGGAIERKLRGFNAFAPLGPLKNCRGSGTTGASPGFLVIAESAGGVLDNLRRLNHEQRT